MKGKACLSRGQSFLRRQVQGWSELPPKRRASIDLMTHYSQTHFFDLSFSKKHITSRLLKGIGILQRMKAQDLEKARALFRFADTYLSKSGTVLINFKSYIEPPLPGKIIRQGFFFYFQGSIKDFWEFENDSDSGSLLLRGEE